MTKYHTTSRRALLGLTGYAALVLPGLISRHGYASDTGASKIEQLSEKSDKSFIDRALDMRDQAIRIGDQAYGAIIVKNLNIVGQSPSHVIVNGDPTAHAEMQAVRDAAIRLDSRDLSGCTLYSSSRACPMCEAAAYWAGIERMVYGDAINDGGRPVLCR
jgi:tRNA(Arg) A34 adenosine deaminase TadA